MQEVIDIASAAVAFKIPKLLLAEISLFDPYPAMELWKAHSLDAPKKRRRPDYSSDRQRPSKKTASAAGVSAGGACADVYDVASDSDNDRGFDHDSDSEMDEDMFYQRQRQRHRH